MIGSKVVPLSPQMPGTRLKSKEFIVQLEGLDELVSNASVTDRNLLAELHYNKNLMIYRILTLKRVFSFGKSKEERAI